MNTNDPYVMAEERLPGYARYRNLDGRRWEVYGQCQGTGVCYGGEPVDTSGVLTPDLKPCTTCRISFVELSPCARAESWNT